MRVTMLLADHAVVAEGKLYINGGGWGVTGPAPTTGAVAIKIDVPWDRANTPIRLQLQLVDEDGNPVSVMGPLGPQSFEVRGDFEVGRPPGTPHGVPIEVPLAVPFGPLPLPAGKRFTWKLKLDDEADETWQLSFSTRELPPGFIATEPDPPTPPR